MALCCYGAYLVHSGDLEQGQARLREAQVVPEHIGVQGELDKMARLLAGDNACWLQW